MERIVSSRARRSVFLIIALVSALGLTCRGNGDVDLSQAQRIIAEPVGTPEEVLVDPTSPQNSNQADYLHDMFSHPPGSVHRLSKFGSIDPVGTTLLTDFDGDGLLNTNEETSSLYVADYPQIDTTVSTPITMRIELKLSKAGSNKEIGSEIRASDMESRKNEGSENFHQDQYGERTEQYEQQIAASSSKSRVRDGGYSSAASSAYSENSNSASSSQVGISGCVDTVAIAQMAAGAPANGGPQPKGCGQGKGSPGTISFDLNLESTEQHAFSYQNQTSSQHNRNWSHQSAQKESSNVRTNVFEDRPNRNNIDREATNVKTDAAAKNARNFRKELNSKTDTDSIIEPDAGYVRAALYIKNRSVNMPVKVRNILCSLVFETPSGQIIPVQSFRLRNPDYSILETEVYGNSEFGPYVIELNNLSTTEVRNAISNGYTPKIYIIDYELRHVQDSNYATVLAQNYDNVKIVEENAKGRTALIKVMAPSYREMYRVAAFDFPELSSNELCDRSAVETEITSESQIRVGTTLYSALRKLECLGMDIEFQHYVLDYTGAFMEPAVPIVYFHGIKSINGHQTNVPCEENPPVLGTGIAAGQYGPEGEFQFEALDPADICYVKVGALKTEDLSTLRLWTVFDNGKFFKNTRYLLNSDRVAGRNPDVTENVSGLIQYFNGSSIAKCIDPTNEAASCDIPTLQGIHSTVWAGDNYDITLLSMADIVEHEQDFGTNPINTGEKLAFDTSWDNNTLGDHPYYPTTNSRYLGEVSFGDKVEFEFTRNASFALNPTFSRSLPSEGGTLYTSYAYKPENISDERFDLYDLIDFDINLGIGGERRHWFNILHSDYIRPTAASSCPAADYDSNDNITNDHCFTACGAHWDFDLQVFSVCLQMPFAIENYDSDLPLDIFIRPALNNARRNSIWPKPYGEVKLFEGIQSSKDETDAANRYLIFERTVGTEQLEEYISINGSALLTSENAGESITITAVTQVGEDVHAFYGSATLPDSFVEGSLLTVDLAEPLRRPEFSFYDYPAFVSLYNDEHLVNLLNPFVDYSEIDCITAYQPFACTGFEPVPTYLANWLGAGDQDNNWADATNFNQIDSLLANSTFSGRFFTKLVLNTYREENPVTISPTSEVSILSGRHYQGFVKGDSYSMVVWSINHGQEAGTYAQTPDGVAFLVGTLYSLKGALISNSTGEKHSEFWIVDSRPQTHFEQTYVYPDVPPGEEVDVYDFDGALTELKSLKISGKRIFFQANVGTNGGATGPNADFKIQLDPDNTANPFGSAQIITDTEDDRAYPIVYDHGQYAVFEEPCDFSHCYTYLHYPVHLMTRNSSFFTLRGFYNNELVYYYYDLYGYSGYAGYVIGDFQTDNEFPDLFPSEYGIGGNISTINYNGTKRMLWRNSLGVYQGKVVFNSSQGNSATHKTLFGPDASEVDYAINSDSRAFFVTTRSVGGAVIAGRTARASGPLGEEFLIDNSPTEKKEPKVAILPAIGGNYDDIALVVWPQKTIDGDYDLYGKLYYFTGDNVIQASESKRLPAGGLEGDQIDVQIIPAANKFILAYNGNNGIRTMVINLGVPNNYQPVTLPAMPHGINNFFISPLYRHTLTLRSRIKPPFEQ